MVKPNKIDNHLSLQTRPIQGTGVGLRSIHYAEIFNAKPNINWFEVLADNFMIEDGMPLVNLEYICELYPITLHCTGMSLGSTDSLDLRYLQKLKFLIDKYQPGFVSDHLSFSRANGINLPDLFPLPYNTETINIIADKIKQAQDFLGVQLLVENVSAYLAYTSSTMPEYEFINQITEKADCGILLDLNNIYVSSFNSDTNYNNFLKNIDAAKVKQYHLAGFSDNGDYLLDTHSNFVTDKVWDIYKTALKIIGNKPALFEWDNDIPPFNILIQEANKANEIMKAMEANYEPC